MLQHLMTLSIRNRWLTVLLTLGLAGVGGWYLSVLPIDAVPDITNNQVQINTSYSTFSPLEMEKQVTFPVEYSLSAIPGLQYTRSLSRNGFSQVTAVFDDSVDIYFARQLIAERLQQANEELPPGARPQMGPVSTGLSEVVMYVIDFGHRGAKGLAEPGKPGWQADGTYLTPEGETLRSDLEQAAYLRTVQDWIVKPQLLTVRNVAGIDSIGGYEKHYAVEPDPSRLLAYGLTFGDLLEALEHNNTSRGGGYIEQHGEYYTVRSDGRVKSLEDIGAIVVRTRNGLPIRIRDVAEVAIGKELRTGAGTFKGEEAVVGTALMLIGGNSRIVADAVKAKLVEVNRSLPPDIVAQVVYDRTNLVMRTVDTVKRNLIEGALLVVVVLFLFLGNVRAALMCALAIPFSMLMAATGMVWAGISGNLMSLGALDFGIIIDATIIIVENCLRRLVERQKDLGRTLTLDERLETVRDASAEVRSASIFGEGVIVLVFLPILTLSGIEGKMFHPMALTFIFALIGAVIFSFTGAPALVAILFRGKLRERQSLILRALTFLYIPALRWALRLRWLTIAFAAAAMAVSVWLFVGMGEEFIPRLDEGDIAMHAMRIPSTSLTQSVEMQKALEKTLTQVPEIQEVFGKTGTAEAAFDPMPPNISDTFLILRPQSEWPDPDKPKSQLVKEIEQLLGEHPGNLYEFIQPIEMRFNELLSGVRGDVAIQIYGEEFGPMIETAEKVLSIVRKVEGASGVKMDQVEGLPTLSIDIDREAVARYGLSIDAVQDLVSMAVGGREAGTLFQGDRRFDIMVRLPERLRGDVHHLEELPVPVPDTDEHGSGGPLVTSVPLRELARLTVDDGVNQVTRQNGKRRITVQCNVRGRDLGSFVAEARERIDGGITRPPGVWIEWGGQFENMLAARKRFSIVVPVCLVAIFVLLYMSYGSVKYALLTFSGVPLALSGGVFALWVRGMPFSISAAVGFIALMGIAVLNGLVLLTMINQNRESGMELERAILGGSVTRLRPVMMTALTDVLGFIPMALSVSAGAEVQRPLATVVIGGVLTSTLLTLVVVPALYRVTHRAGR